MAIAWQEAVRVGRSLIGTPYSGMDCINLIKRIIRIAPGGVKGYTTAGTNSLWKSYGMSAKYRDITWRQEGLAGAKAGMLAFKRSGSDVHHVGLVTGEDTVIHASSALGRTEETPLTAQEGWNLLAVHRHIAVKEEAAGEEKPVQEGTQGVVIIDSEQNAFVPIGDFRVLFGSVD